MKITIRMLSLTTIILWIITIFFVVTAVYSVTQLGLQVGAVQMLPSSEGIDFSLPFSITNNGYYEIADVNLTTRITDPNGTLVDQSETIVASIPQGTTKNATHRVPIDLDTIMSIDYVPLLLNDSYFEVELFAGLSFARAIPIQVSTNATIPWGAPLANFYVGSPSIAPYNGTHSTATMPVSFENHAVLDLLGTLKLELFSNSQELIVSGETAIIVPSGGSYNGEIITYPRQQDISKLSSRGVVHMIFETPMFVVDWEESYG